MLAEMTPPLDNVAVKSLRALLHGRIDYAGLFPLLNWRWRPQSGATRNTIRVRPRGRWAVLFSLSLEGTSARRARIWFLFVSRSD